MKQEIPQGGNSNNKRDQAAFHYTVYEELRTNYPPKDSTKWISVIKIHTSLDIEDNFLATWPDLKKSTQSLMQDNILSKRAITDNLNYPAFDDYNIPTQAQEFLWEFDKKVSFTNLQELLDFFWRVILLGIKYARETNKTNLLLSENEYLHNHKAELEKAYPSIFKHLRSDIATKPDDLHWSEYNKFHKVEEDELLTELFAHGQELRSTQKLWGRTLLLMQN